MGKVPARLRFQPQLAGAALDEELARLERLAIAMFEDEPLLANSVAKLVHHLEGLLPVLQPADPALLQ